MVKVTKTPTQKTNQKSTKTTTNSKQKTEATKQTRKAIYRVAYDKENRVWTIKKDGAMRTIASFPTKDEALKRVKELAANQDLNFVVRKKDGKFQKK